MQKVKTSWRAARRSCHGSLWPLPFFGCQLVRYLHTEFFKLFFRYHCHSTQYARVPLGTANKNAYFQDTGLLGCFTGWHVGSPQTCQRCVNLRFRSCWFSNLTPIYDRGESVYTNNEIVQGDQKVSVHMTITVQSSGTQILFDDLYLGINFITVFLYISTHFKQFKSSN